MKAEELIGRIYISVPFQMLKEQYLDLIIDFGVNPEISFYADALETYSSGDFKSVADRLLEAGRSVTFHATYLDLSAGSPDPLIREATRKRFEQVLDLVPLFRPRTVVSHVGFEKRRYHAIRERWLENAVETFTWFARRLREENVRLMLENVFEDGPDDIRALYERLDGLAGWCFDIGHQTAFSKMDMEGWMDGLGPFLGQMHLHDNRGEWDDHLAPGNGTIDFPALFARLKDRKDDPPVVTIEPHNEPNVWKSVEYLAKIWPW